MNKLELQKKAVEVRKGIVTGVYSCLTAGRNLFNTSDVFILKLDVFIHG